MTPRSLDDKHQSSIDPSSVRHTRQPHREFSTSSCFTHWRLQLKWPVDSSTKGRLSEMGRWNKELARNWFLSSLVSEKDLAVLRHRLVAKRSEIPERNQPHFFIVTVFNIQPFCCCAFWFIFFDLFFFPNLLSSPLLLLLPAATSRHASSFAWAC